MPFSLSDSAMTSTVVPGMMVMSVVMGLPSPVVSRSAISKTSMLFLIR